MQNEYYGAASTPTEDFLAHYGIKGMKWGVRKAIERGDNVALGRHYRKAQKKLAKLEKQAKNVGKFKKRAIGMGVGAAAAGGLAAAGTKGVAELMRKSARLVTPGAKAVGGVVAGTGKLLGKAANIIPGQQPNLANAAFSTIAAGNRIRNNAVGAGQAVRGAANSVVKWGRQNTLSDAIRRPMIKGSVANNGVIGQGLNNAQGALRGVSNNTLARIGAGAVGVGLAAGAARNAYKARTAEKKAKQFRAEMNKAFAGTKYANGAPASKKSRKRRGSRA